MDPHSSEGPPKEESDVKLPKNIEEVIPVIESDESPISSESPEQREQEIKKARQNIKALKGGSEVAPDQSHDARVRAEKNKQFVKKFLPYPEKGPISQLAMNLWTKGVTFELVGKENIPASGPFIVICNHFGGGDSEALLKTFADFDPHLAVAKNIWWDRSLVVKLFLKTMRMIPIEESLANLTDEEKEVALANQTGEYEKGVFRRIIDREKSGKPASNIEFMRQALALLLRGDVLCLYPEGIWINPQGSGSAARETGGLKKGYPGVELIARLYKERTGEDLPVLPTAFHEDESTKMKELRIGQPLMLKDNDTELSDIDWCMSQVGALLEGKTK